MDLCRDFGLKPQGNWWASAEPKPLTLAIYRVPIYLSIYWGMMIGWSHPPPCVTSLVPVSQEPQPLCSLLIYNTWWWRSGMMLVGVARYHMLIWLSPNVGSIPSWLPVSSGVHCWHHVWQGSGPNTPEASVYFAHTKSVVRIMPCPLPCCICWPRRGGGGFCYVGPTGGQKYRSKSSLALSRHNVQGLRLRGIWGRCSTRLRDILGWVSWFRSPVAIWLPSAASHRTWIRLLIHICISNVKWSFALEYMGDHVNEEAHGWSFYLVLVPLLL